MREKGKKIDRGGREEGGETTEPSCLKFGSLVWTRENEEETTRGGRAARCLHVGACWELFFWTASQDPLSLTLTPLPDSLIHTLQHAEGPLRFQK